MFILFFFFQAEDGIRDDLVTGVQTCALPISSSPDRARRADVARRPRPRARTRRALSKGRTKDRKSTRLNSSHQIISYAVFCLKKKKTKQQCMSQTVMCKSQLAITHDISH